MATHPEGERKLTGDGAECAASSPGDFNSAMTKAGLMKNHFHVFNGRDRLEAGRKDWIITRNFIPAGKEKSYRNSA